MSARDEPAADQDQTTSEAQTEQAARVLAVTLRAGDCVLLIGPLGAGKTAFVRGLADGLGASGGAVSSPTFALVHHYHGGRLPLVHADLYRLAGTTAEELGLEDPSARAGVVAIEWPDRLTHAMSGAITVTIDPTGETTRRIRIERR